MKGRGDMDRIEQALIASGSLPKGGVKMFDAFVSKMKAELASNDFFVGAVFRLTREDVRRHQLGSGLDHRVVRGDGGWYKIAVHVGTPSA